MEKRDVPFAVLGGLFEQDDIDTALKIMKAASQPGGSFSPLPEEDDFQKALAEHEGAKHAFIVNSCGTALDLAMMVLEIGPGDEVISTGNTFAGTATCAATRGAKVVFADVDPGTMCLDGEAIERKISERTKAIIPMHFAGLACKIEDIETLMVKYDIPIIYDAAHAVGARRNNLPVGKWGLACCYSFNSNQNMTTLGEGGALLTNDDDFAEQIRQEKFNCRMTKVQAAVGLSQLAKIDRINAEKRERFLRMAELLADVEEVRIQEGIDDQHACNLFVVELHLDKLKCDRDEFRKLLQDEYQVGTGLHYPAVWSREAARQLEYGNSDCPHTERICSSVISLPAFPRTSEEELQYVVWALKQLIAEQRK